MANYSQSFLEDDLKRRIALARQQGWSDDEINRSATIQRALNSRVMQNQSRTQARQTQDQPVASKSGTGFGSFFLGLLPGGSLIDKKMHNEQITSGDVALEAGLSVIPFGLGKAFRAAKGGVKAAKGVKAANDVNNATRRELADLFVNKAPSPNRTASTLLKQSTISPKSTLDTAEEQKRLVDLTRTMPKMRGSATRKFNNVGSEISRMSDDVDQLFAGVDKTLPAKGFRSDLKRVRNDIVDTNERKRFDIEFDRILKGTFKDKAPTNMSATDLNALRRGVNGQMSSIYKKIEAGTTLTDKDHALLRLKQTLDGHITALAPKEIKGQVDTLNRNMNTLIKGTPELKRASEQTFAPAGVNIPGVSQAIPQVIQSATDLAGRGIVQAQKLTRSGIGDELKKQALVRLGADITGIRDNQQPQQPNQVPLPEQSDQLFANPQNDTEDILNEIGARTDATDFDTFARAFDEASANPGTQGNNGMPSAQDLTQAAIEATMAGDFKTADQYAQLAELVSSQAVAAQKASGGGNGLNVTKVTAQQYGLAQNGAQALQQLAGLLQNDPNVLSRSATPGRSLPGVGGFVSRAAGTGDFDAIGYNIADTILRLRTGATANEGEVRKLQAQIMPRAGDSHQTVTTKLNQINSIFGNVLTLANQQPSYGEEDQIRELFGNYQGNAYAY